MRRAPTIAIILVILALGAGAYFFFTKERNQPNSEVTNVNGTMVNAAANPGLIFGIAPAKGPAAGGTKVTITGESFTGTPKVFFGEAEGTDVQIKSEKEMTVVSPKNAKGVVDVILKNPTGPTSSLQDGYTYE